LRTELLGHLVKVMVMPAEEWIGYHIYSTWKSWYSTVWLLLKHNIYVLWAVPYKNVVSFTIISCPVIWLDGVIGHWTHNGGVVGFTPQCPLSGYYSGQVVQHMPVTLFFLKCM